MKKKGVEMSLNVIIVAVIGLLILVILAFLVVNYVGKAQNQGFNSCVAAGGVCKSSCTALTPPSSTTPISGTHGDCVTPAVTCCKVLSTG